ncbi:hypothetical protein DM860_017627 [Cuscuta australis]|uniref:Uncharacterized protein n=1 Tax=Cuscuta australis TaxID=267555 RepID=A0A328EDP3_9ASTE|nr:hypothetical protein DM860_017627 [Cuscuta australis]
MQYRKEHYSHFYVDAPKIHVSFKLMSHKIVKNILGYHDISVQEEASLTNVHALILARYNYHKPQYVYLLNLFVGLTKFISRLRTSRGSHDELKDDASHMFSPYATNSLETIGP